MRGLLPCPFCGWAAIMREWTSGMHYYRAECSNTEGCDCHGLQHLTLGEAIVAWNRRAEPENKPLTQEEVSAMCGEPLYVIPLDADADWDKHWAIMHWDSVTANSILSKGKMYFLYEADYGKTWLAYRTRPSRPREAGDG